MPKIENLMKNRKLDQQLQMSPKIENYTENDAKNRNFTQALKFLSKIEI